MTLGSISLDNIKVGYITDDGYVSGVSIADANAYEKLNPETVFIFIDGNKKNWKLENLELLCYNCYFLNVGNVWSDNQLQQMEDYNQKNKFNNDPEPDWEMDESHIEHLKKLGLWDEKEDGEEFIDFS